MRCTSTQYDVIVVAWQQAELERSNAEGRGHASQVYKLQSQMEETYDTIEALRRENKSLTGARE